MPLRAAARDPQSAPAGHVWHLDGVMCCEAISVLTDLNLGAWRSG